MLDRNFPSSLLDVEGLRIFKKSVFIALAISKL